jgi:hypothetical protein
MPRSLSKPRLLARRVPLGLKLVSQLIELVQIDPGPETECMRNGFRCRVSPRLRLLAETGAQRPVHHVLERQPKLASATLQEPGEVVIDGEGGAHLGASSVQDDLMSRHQPGPGTPHLSFLVMEHLNLL